MSSVYRFHRPTGVLPGTSRKLLRKRKPHQIKELILISSDAYSLTDANGTRPIETYRDHFVRRPITLTRREADFVAIANPGIEPPAVLEEIYPWLPRRPFLKDSAANYRNLCSIIRRYGRHLVTPAAFCDEKWNTICNAIRMKNDLDARFYTAWHLPIQDVSILEERRFDRSVIAIDVNAMYPACMQQLFPKPMGLRLVSYNRKLESAEELPLGLYRCILQSPKTNFIQLHNPFRSFFSGKHLRARIWESVEVDLNEFELTFYRRHFEQIHLVDAVISDQGVLHPLAKEVRRSFARRRNYLVQNNKALADREKFFSTFMSSCAGRPSRSRILFQRREDAMEYLRANHGISPPDDEPNSATDAWLRGNKGITVTSAPSGVSVDSPSLRDGSACFLLGQRIVARGRIVLLEMMEKILSIAPGVEICYTNIDSIHFSLPTVHLANVLEKLRAEASGEMGLFKIEAVTRHGLWLEPGKYWLYSDFVEKFANRSVCDQEKPFKDHSIHVTSRKIGDLYVPIRATLRMDQTMSDMRTIVFDPETGLTHQRLVEIDSTTSFTKVLDQLDENRRHCIPKRLLAFKALHRRIGNHLAPLPRGEVWKPA